MVVAAVLELDRPPVSQETYVLTHLQVCPETGCPHTYSEPPDSACVAPCLAYSVLGPEPRASRTVGAHSSN